MHSCPLFDYNINNNIQSRFLSLRWSVATLTQPCLTATSTALSCILLGAVGQELCTSCEAFDIESNLLCPLTHFWLVPPLDKKVLKVLTEMKVIDLWCQSLKSKEKLLRNRQSP
jgi:hypothetical protein